MAFAAPSLPDLECPRPLFRRRIAPRCGSRRRSWRRAGGTALRSGRSSDVQTLVLGGSSSLICRQPSRATGPIDDADRAVGMFAACRPTGTPPPFSGRRGGIDRGPASMVDALVSPSTARVVGIAVDVASTLPLVMLTAAAAQLDDRPSVRRSGRASASFDPRYSERQFSSC